MNSLAPSNLPVSSADIVVGLVGSKVQERPESPEKKRKIQQEQVEVSVADYFLSRSPPSWRLMANESFPRLVGRGDYANKGLY